MTSRRTHRDDRGAAQSASRPPNVELSDDDDEEGSNDDSSSEDEEEDSDDTTTQLNDSVVIAIMGMTGAGKSTFISKLTEAEVEIGHTLESCTSKPGFYKYMHKGKNIMLLDTPGFDDTHRSDAEILKDIALCLSGIYDKGIALAGIVYLHRITDVRMTGSAFVNLQMLEKLLGEDALSRVVIATTMWNRLDRSESKHSTEVGENRQKELKDTFWGQFQRKGSLVTKHEGDAQSAQAIVSHLIKDNTNVVLDIQREMVDEGLELSQTAAGKFLQSEHLKMRERYERDLADAQEAIEVARGEKDQGLVSELSQHQEDCRSAITRMEGDNSILEIDFERLLEEKEKQFATLAADVQAERKARAAEMKLIESHLTKLKKTLSRQEKKHSEDIKRLKRHQRRNSVSEKQEYERLYAQIKNQIIVLEEKRLEAASSMTSFGVFGVLNAIFNNGRLETHNSYQPLARNYQDGRHLH